MNHTHLLGMAVWAFEILELAPLGCDREAGEPRDSLTIRCSLIPVWHSEQPHTSELRSILIESDRLPTSRERTYPLDQAIGKIGC